MTGAYDQPRPEKGLNATNLVFDLLGHGGDEEFLRVDASHKCDPAYEILAQGFGVHVGSQCLDRVETIYACLDELIDDFVNGSAGVKDGLVTMVVSLLGESGEPGHDELVELFRPADQVALCTEVIAEEESVHAIPGDFEESLVGFVVESTNVVGGSLNDVWMGVHFDHVAFQTEEVHQVVVEAGPHSAGAIHISGGIECVNAFVEMEIVRIRPEISVHFFDGLTVCEWMGTQRVIQGKARVEHDAPLGVLIDIGEKLRADPSEVVTDVPAELLLRRRIEMGVKGRPAVCMRLTQPKPHPVCWLPGDDPFDSFSAGHM